MTHYAVLGDPIQHSLSPLIFKLFAEQTEQHLDYQALVVKQADLPATLVRLRSQGYQGVNLTAPLKERALLWADVCSERARVAKAINFLSFRQDGTCYGDNSDGLGFIRDLIQRKKCALKAKTVLVVGAGGAARGILASILQESPSQVVICNRTEIKARQLIDDFQKPASPLRFASWQELPTYRFDLVIHCTTAGMQGELPPLPEAILKPAACCYELSYGENALPFQTWAKSQGAAYIYDGLGMLVEQAAEAFYWWRNHRPATDPVLHQLTRLQPVIAT